METTRTGQRCYKDHDIEAGDSTVYVLGDGEWWDPMTTTNYHNGVSAHAMYGPCVVVVREVGGGVESRRYDYNDPAVRELIKQ